MLSSQVEQSEAEKYGTRAYQKRNPEPDVLLDQGRCDNGLATNVHTPVSMCQIPDCGSTTKLRNAFLPVVDVESILDSRLTVNNDALSCLLADPDSSFGRMALLRYSVAMVSSAVATTRLCDKTSWW